MSLDKSRFTELIKNFKFEELFNELGWDHINAEQLIAVEEVKFKLNAVAEKRGFVVFICSPNSEGKIPPYNIRKKIDAKISQLYFEHLIIYTDKNNVQQVWQLVIREPDKPVVVRETPYFSSQHPDLLFQRLRGIFISLDDEEKITLIDISSKVREQFNTNAEKVTKKFYQEFKDQHTAFINFIKGIENVVDHEWYASLMLNRLMFIYFIQKKGFLDNNNNYLVDKLKETKKKKGENKFYSFYRNFLLVLFHKGLGSPERDDKLLKEIGKVPYLNGGLFDVHKIEKDYKKIEIEDKAFERIFKFFDEYNWHLDTKITATGRDINPDVIGYIFEKYINDRAAMGAYYTKEDITEYIAKNTILPFLFDQVKKDCAEAFKDDSSLWKMLRDNPDRYIYDAVKHGIYQTVIASPEEIGTKQSQPKIRELPPEIQIGRDTTQPNLLERRKEWNKSAPDEFALPSEIWREVVERRNRYFDIKTKIENGEIKEINDFITYNLNIRQFAQDAVEQYEGSDFITAFYKAIKKITILDPTCGSGAFLFAALNILELLYEACISRMRGFIEQDNLAGGKKFKNFRDVIEEIKNHPNEKYYIYKSTILSNLYGVDIMNEAVEIAKLRLFLKLVAEVEDFDHLEPLPDIDFNIRAGNTLIGFATKEELDKGLTWSLNVGADTKIVYDELDVVAKAFKRYKEIQLEDETDHKGFKKAKDELNERLKNLNDTLNDYLGNDYGKSRKKKQEFERWLVTYKPFHWFAEFYEIINNGGFNVIIGNPPYVVYNGKNFPYQIRNLKTLECQDLYSFVIEKSVSILIKNGAIGMIVPISIVSTDGFDSLRMFLFSSMDSIYFTNYAMRPSKLFEGAEKHLTIFITNRTSAKKIFTSRYFRWYSEERNYLFSKISYIKTDNLFLLNSSIPKTDSILGANIINKLKKNKAIQIHTVSISNHKVLHTRKLRYFLQFLEKPPEIFDEKGNLRVTSELKEICFSNQMEKRIALATYLSTLFFWYYIAFSDCRNLNKREVFSFPLSMNKIPESIKTKLSDNAVELMNNLQKNSYYQEASYKAYGLLKMQVFQPRLSKEIIDEIDKVLAEHYGFTEEELDFIINYDIKYRMGKELEEED
ncbi:MAG: hypothetical protein B6D44_10190 [Ignavibacteriales bacterium UTCHB2]|jgi:hypothetical protein|nr:MAG: hypothetical protein B6D44_10190 [Ignavibacteriales bacterium UTCHB2]